MVFHVNKMNFKHLENLRMSILCGTSGKNKQTKEQQQKGVLAQFPPKGVLHSLEAMNFI